MKTVLKDAEVTIHDFVTTNQDSVLNNCTVTVKPQSRKVHITPRKQPNRHRNRKIYDCEGVKVMTRADGSYVLYASFSARDPQAEVVRRLNRLTKKGFDTAYEYEVKKEGGRG